MLSKKLTKSLLRTTDNYIKALEKAGILTVWDLLDQYPREYEDRTNVLDSFSLINIKEKNTILVKLVSINTTKTANNKLLTKAVLEDKNWFLSEAVWFNRKYLASQLKNSAWRKVLVSGKVKYAFWKVTFNSPDVETDLSKVSGEIVALYSDLNYIPSKWTSWKIELLRSFIKSPPSNLSFASPPNPPLEGGTYTELLPEHIVKKYNFISKAEAVYKIHFPKNKHDIEEAKRRLWYEELYEINYKALSSKYEKFQDSEGKSPAIPLNVEFVKEILSQLPFELTDHQKIALFQVLKDMEKPHAMQRLLEWDVWTGKTVVALVAVIHGIKAPPSPPLEGGTQPPLAPLWEGGTLLSSVKKIDYSIRKGELKSPWYVFELAKKFRKNLTESEQKLWDVLRLKNLEGLKFRRQHPIWRYIADFYCEELQLIIELDWKIHDEKYQKNYDEARNNLLQNYWFDIIRLKNEEILEKNEQEIKELLLNIIPPSKEDLGGEKTNNSPLQRGARAGGNRIQVAIMAPTAILATQHFNSMQNLLFEFGISSELLIWATTAKQKKEIKEKLKTGNVDVIIWTHALVQEDVIFNNLWFVIIDEQHRFWVKQREKLEKNISNISISSYQRRTSKVDSPLQRGARGGEVPPSKGGLGGELGGCLIPHSLNMTATPIPRTLALTLYGDQDLSVITEYPKWRKEIFTKVARWEQQRHQIELFVEAELKKWRQVFWVSPLVEESEKIDLANAQNTFETLQAVYQEFNVWLIHGKMKPKEKDRIMADFKDNKIQVLSSTTVIEVWIDIPNASIICIEWAERFGLSQLHQIRWRVGRGDYQSYCYLFPTKWNKTDRLKAMENTNNGFELSEIDLELRWPWEVYGLRQSGVPDLKVASLTDLELVSQIREDIEEMFEKKEKSL